MNDLATNLLATGRNYWLAAALGTLISAGILLVAIPFAAGITATGQANTIGLALLAFADLIAYRLGQAGVQRLPGNRGLIGFFILSLLFPWFLLPIMLLSFF